MLWILSTRKARGVLIGLSCIVFCAGLVAIVVRQTRKSVAPTESYVVEVRGVTLEYEWLVGDAPKVRSDADSVTVDTSQYSLRIVDRYLVLNGYKYGSANVGDRVRVTFDGRHFVNDSKRRAVSAGF